MQVGFFVPVYGGETKEVIYGSYGGFLLNLGCFA